MAAWDNLSMRDKSEIMGIHLKSGINILEDIKNSYNKYAGGGDLNDNNWDINTQKPIDTEITPPIDVNNQIYKDYDTKNSQGKPTIHKMSEATRNTNIQEIADESIKQNVNPYLALAISNDETTLGQYGNPIGNNTALFHLNPEQFNGVNSARAALGVRSVKDKMDYGTMLQRQGKIPKGDDYLYQSYQGYGKINVGHPDLQGATSMRGIPISAGGNNYKTNPSTGRRLQQEIKTFKKDQNINAIVNNAAIRNIIPDKDINFSFVPRQYNTTK